SFAWEPLERVVLPRPRDGALKSLVRRIFARPVPLRPPHRPSVKLHGPHIVSGGWWVQETQRDYYFAETRHGELLWVFYEPNRRQWFLHGKVE
ncbi:MAG: DNA polymerase Y family protein, partial [bacterium]